ncbi:MAG TPA: S9 family peptidase, partial [Acidobacteriota bacterium]|nr:S9 family peptidase [Acidobacteriota bacterium]
MKKLLAFSLLVLIQITTVKADQTKKELTVELVSIKNALVDPSISEVLWSPDASRITYFRQKDKSDDAVKTLYSFDVQTLKEDLLFDPTSEKETFTLKEYEWSPKSDAILLQEEKDLWLLDLKTRNRKQITNDADAEEYATFSPKGDQVAFVKKNNLYVINIATGESKQLTTDGSDKIYNGKLDWVYEEELSFRGSARAFEWSPDGKKIFYLRLDENPVQQYPLIDYSSIPVSVTWQQYPKAGSPNPKPSVHVVSIDKNQHQTSKLDSNVEYIGPRYSWTLDSKAVSYWTLNRSQTELAVHLWNPDQQSDKTILEEKDPYWIDPLDPPRFLKNGKQFLWFSQRDGWFHLYLYQNDGKLVRQITKGNWMIEQAWKNETFEDEEKNWIYFASTEKDPRERHIYRIHFDGTGMERLSDEAGTHEPELSPDGNFLIDTFSSVNETTKITLLKSNGTSVKTLDEPKNQLSEYSLAKTEWAEVNAEDGTKLYGMLWKPQTFDASKKYPVIVYVYAGPWGQEVTNSWQSLFKHLLVQNGFLIWTLDNRGTPGRGHEIQTKAIYKRSGEIELKDQLTGVSYLKSLPFVDPARIGIWGWSYGGYFTLYATTHSDAFKCAVAGAPVTDWKYYDTIYTERYMKTPEENLEGYKKASVLESAARLQSTLLLIHGLADDNVHPQNTINFIDALIKARKPYQLYLQPSQKHGFDQDEALIYLNQRILEFFKTNL